MRDLLIVHANDRELNVRFLKTGQKQLTVLCQKLRL